MFSQGIRVIPGVLCPKSPPLSDGHVSCLLLAGVGVVQGEGKAVLCQLHGCLNVDASPGAGIQPRTPGIVDGG